MNEMTSLSENGRLFIRNGALFILKNGVECFIPRDAISVLYRCARIQDDIKHSPNVDIYSGIAVTVKAFQPIKEMEWEYVGVSFEFYECGIRVDSSFWVDDDNFMEELEGQIGVF